jgi:23S rRNA (cytosine1962-C5)-methyltransferase
MSLFSQALAARSSLLHADTDAVRLIDGAGDGLPGVYVETFASHWLVSTTGASVPAAVAAWLREQNRSIYHKCLSQQQKESPTHFHGPRVDAPFLARENGVNFEISFHSGYSQGIFLDQRDNRQRVRSRVQKGDTILNTFAYTGVFSVFGALGGAQTTTLDLSQPYLDWAKRNFSHNQLDPLEHHFCKGDTFHWLRRFEKQGRKFHGIILDPPTFSRDEKGTVFRVENDYGALANLAHRCLHPGGWLLCSTNCHKLHPKDFERQLRAALPRSSQFTHTPMPPDFTDAPYLKSVWVEC